MTTSRNRPPGAGAPSRPWGLGDGTRLRRDRSTLADAQRRYNAAADDDEALRAAVADPPSRSALRRTSPPSDAALTLLSRQARALYEARVVPVREVARLCGVSVAGLYYHVRRQGWRRRRALVPRDKAKSERQRLRYQALKAARPAAPRGLKARDPDGQAVALAAARRAGELAGAALAKAIARQDAESRARTLTMLGHALRDVAIANGVVKAKRLKAQKTPAKPRAKRKEWRAIGETPLWADNGRVRR